MSDVAAAGAGSATLAQRYELLLSQSSDVVFCIDDGGNLEWVSPVATRVTGWTPEQLVGRRAFDVVVPQDADRVEVVAALLRNGRTVTFEGLHRHASGYDRWMLITVSPVRDPDGQLVRYEGSARDVHQEVEARRALAESEAATLRDHDRLRATLNTLFDPHVLLEAVRVGDEITDFRVVEANDAACDYFGHARGDFIGATLLEVVAAEVAPSLVEMHREVVLTEVPLVLDDFPVFDPSFERRERRLDVRAVKVGEGVSSTWRDVTDRHDFEARLAHLATHDPLTGLANRAALLDELNRALHAGRRARRRTAVVMLDLDNFKFVNDAMGHAMGDQLLHAAALKLQSLVRAGDLLARLGGDEFVVVMRDIDDVDEALGTGLRIVDAFRSPITVAGHLVAATVSAGVTVSVEQSTADELIREADAAMYRAKEHGRDRAALYNDAVRDAADARGVLEEQLRPALDLGQLVVFFQPEVDLYHGRVCGVEALVRWQHPSGELYNADRFIDLAEETGLIVDIGRWVIRESCRMMAAWSSRPTSRMRTLYLNLSRAQLGDPRLADEVQRIIAETRVPSRLLCVEVAESSLLRVSATVLANLDRLRGMGLRLAIDGFGSGDAGLAHLRDHRVDVVKIDRTFIHRAEDDDYAFRLVAGITALAQRVGLAVVAEGVETESQAALLRDLGCASALGYLYSGAVPVAELTALLERHFTSG